MSREIAERTDHLTGQLIDTRRTIHQNPELGFEEKETSALISRELGRLNIPHRNGIGKTGVVGIIEGGRDGKTLLIRADMDCLPVEEKTGLPFASKNPGRMHACGHDVHATILLGVAEVLSGLSDRLAGRVKLVFQPNEEGLTGAQAMIDDGVLEDPPVDMCLGYHNWPPLDAGVIGYHPDVCFSSSDAFDLVLKGRSGHAAHPHLAIDTVTAAAYFVTQLQTVVSREVSPVHPSVVSIGKIEGGTVRNVLPDSVRLEATVRTQNAEAKANIESAIRRILDGLKAGMRVDYDLDYQPGVPVLRNNKDVLKQVLGSARSILGDDKVTELPEGSMGSEDFAFFTERYPSAHLRIGGKIEGLDTALHRSNYDCNELAIPTGVKAVSQAAVDLLS
ncbi:MAG: M20 family metallopeptidase [Rhodospirillales bacterium]|nr:M20 family metallopeptidase [Rhodospirillales bacterium]